MFAPTTRISPLTSIRRTRSLSTSGRVLIRVGQKVDADDIVAESSYNTNNILLDVASSLGVRREACEGHIILQVGDNISKGDLIAGPVGITKRVVRAPCDGRIILVREHLVVLENHSSPERIIAGYPGEIISWVKDQGVVIQSKGAVIQGVWGTGSIVCGTLRNVYVERDILQKDPDGSEYFNQIIFTPSINGEEVFNAIKNKNPLGIITARMTPSLYITAGKIDLPVLLLVGFGLPDIHPQITNILNRYQGSQITLNAEPNDSYTGKRPEVFIPLLNAGHVEPQPSVVRFSPNKPVRVCSSPHAGKMGVIMDMIGTKVLANGVRTETALVRFNDDESDLVPVGNLEIILS